MVDVANFTYDRDQLLWPFRHSAPSYNWEIKVKLNLMTVV